LCRPPELGNPVASIEPAVERREHVTRLFQDRLRIGAYRWRADVMCRSGGRLIPQGVHHDQRVSALAQVGEGGEPAWVEQVFSWGARNGHGGQTSRATSSYQCSANPRAVPGKGAASLGRIAPRPGVSAGPLFAPSHEFSAQAFVRVRECGCRGVPGRTGAPLRSGPLPGREPRGSSARRPGSAAPGPRPGPVP